MSAFGGGTSMQSGVIDNLLNMPSADLRAQIGDFGMAEETSAQPMINAPMQDMSPMLTSSSIMPERVIQQTQPQQFQPKPRAPIEELMPYVEITEQPRQRGLRFRYQCEGRSAGSIPGQSSTAEKKTFPTIKIQNHRGPAIVVVSCVTKDSPYKPHPHCLVGKDCKKGVCTVKVKDTTVVSFPHLGIQCAKKKGIEESLKLRKTINVDPFQTGFEFNNVSSEMNAVRLCFQVFLPDSNGKITKVLQPVVSHAIHDKKALNDLVICRLDRSSGKAQGGDEVFLLCEKINKDDIGVRFYEESVDGTVVWENYGEFGAGDVHRQYAIVFRTPPYRECYISRPFDVHMQLQRPSDGETSEPISFTYMPEDPDPDRIEEKRKRKAERMVTLEQDIGAGPRCGGANVNVKDGLRNKLKANRKFTQAEIKTEVTTPVLPSYSLGNINTSGYETNPSNSSSFSFRTTDNTTMGNITIAPNNNLAQHSEAIKPNQVYNIMQDLTQQGVNYTTGQSSFDSSNIDPQVLMEYLQDNGLDGRDILSFESLDMLSGGTAESLLTGLQQVGANELVASEVPDCHMDSETFQNAHDVLNQLQN
ncbi:putative transcription factor p65 homolog [Patella vulgata]|uniref:putative transcription factor p65 homolog n=1 Tax=Patella vulgata TaxID=6465 RepID=UPI0024A80AC0|nr:putative transcription factor p65 homolog [Patella vulgata]